MMQVAVVRFPVKIALVETSFAHVIDWHDHASHSGPICVKHAIFLSLFTFDFRWQASFYKFPTKLE